MRNAVMEYKTINDAYLLKTKIQTSGKEIVTEETKICQEINRGEKKICVWKGKDISENNQNFIEKTFIKMTIIKWLGHTWKIQIRENKTSERNNECSTRSR